MDTCSYDTYEYLAVFYNNTLKLLLDFQFITRGSYKGDHFLLLDTQFVTRGSYKGDILSTKF